MKPERQSEQVCGVIRFVAFRAGMARCPCLQPTGGGYLSAPELSGIALRSAAPPPGRYESGKARPTCRKGRGSQADMPAGRYRTLRGVAEGSSNKIERKASQRPPCGRRDQKRRAEQDIAEEVLAIPSASRSPMP